MTFITGYSKLALGKVITNDDQYVVEATSVEHFAASLYDQLKSDYPKFYKMDMQCKLGFLAAELIVRKLPLKPYAADSIAVVLTNADASLDTDMRFQASISTAPSPSLFVYTLANIVIGELCIRHDIKGENAFFVTPTFDPELTTRYMEEVLRQSHVQAALSGWVNVVGEQYDVFLYLTEKKQRGLSIPHTAANVADLYQR